jgi:hypothetical protein
MILRVLIVASILILALTCSSSRCEDTRFFPDRIFSEREELHNFYVKTFGEYLEAMNEPSLYTKESAKGKDLFRVLWLRNDDKPVAFRFEGDKNESNCSFVELDRKKGRSSISVSNRRSKHLSPGEWGHLMGLIKEMGFWGLPSVTTLIVLDGDVWVLEGRAGDKYHAVMRWYVGPDYRPILENQKFMELCVYLSQLMGHDTGICVVK